MLREILPIAITSSAVFGATLLWMSHAERRRASLKARLTAIAMRSSRADPPGVALRKPLPQCTALPAKVVARLDRAFASAGGRIGPLHLCVTGFIAAATIGLMALLGEFPIAFAIALCVVAAIGAPILLLQIAQSWYQRRFLDAFPDALDLIVRAVRAGLPAPEAIEAVTREARPPVGAEFQRMLDEMRIGTGMEEALQHAAERVRVPDFRFFVVSLLMQRQTGGGIAETLSNLSTIIRQRVALRRKVRALTAEAQASAAVVGITPFIAGGGLFLINRELMSVLFVDPRGRFMLGIAVVCLLLGVVAMRAMISKNPR